jgi:HD-like signal output (HDOD) protein
MTQDRSLLDRINQFIESGNFELPVLNAIGLSLFDLGTDSSLDVGEIENLIASDQALAAEVLRMANSPFYGGLSSISTIRNAIVRLGLRQVQRLIMLASQRAHYQAGDPELSRILQLLWSHASATALGAQWISEKIQAKAIGEICFIGGLLHDIGQLVILRAIDEIKQGAESSEIISASLIREVLAAAHSQMGYNLLNHWNLPEVYQRIALHHHSDEFDPADLPLAIVRLANEATKKLGISLDPDPSIVLSSTPEANALKISDITLAEFEIMIEDYWPAAENRNNPDLSFKQTRQRTASA